jgi:hypothetical protein
MTGSTGHWMKVALLALVALAGSHAGAQPAGYRCYSGRTATYSQVPCAGGRPIGGEGARRVTDKSKAPPQDRAVAAKRAPLSAQERQECRALDRQLREEQRMLRVKGEAATLDDEMPLVRAKKRFRELKC